MWRFRKLTEEELERNPHEAEFFNIGDIDKSASVVREVIQNSLDARLSEERPVFVRFTLGKHGKKDNDNYYSGLIPHIVSCGLSPQVYETEKEVPFLTIEDFGTTGLDGAVKRNDLHEGDVSNYYNFWRREGKSEKKGIKAGRWGLGKTAINIASDIRSFWGLTIRNDDKRELLLGKSLLKTHSISGETFDYYGYYAADASAPIEEKTTLKCFHSRFGLSRNGEPGLSLVIPFPAAEISLDSIVRSIIIYYFFPIIKGMLVVEVRDSSTSTSLTGATLRETANKQDWKDTPWEDRQVDSLMEFLEDAVTMPAPKIIVLQMPSGTPHIKEELLGDKLTGARNMFARYELICLQVPVKIHQKDEAEVDSHFEVYLKKDDGLTRADEFYVRGGITISEIKKLGNRKVRGLLSAQEKAVNMFLGDSESPAHTDWKERVEEFQEKYYGATGTLRYVKSSMADMIRILDQPSPKLDRDFLQDIFFIPEDKEKKQDTSKKPVIEVVPSKPRKFVTNQIKEGFRITLRDKEITLPVSASIKVAYDIRRGNPFSNYHPWDFDFAGISINKVISGGNIVETGHNFLRFDITQSDFELRVTGFDEHRDLVVDVRGVV